MPPEYKTLAGVCMAFSTLTILILTTAFPTLLVVLRPYGTYWLLAGGCGAGNVLYCKFMPETKGMSIVEIRQMFIKQTGTASRVNEGFSEDQL